MSWDFNFTEEPPAAARSAAEAAAPEAVLVIPDLHPNGVWALQALADVRELPAILALRPYLPQSEPPTLTSPVAVQLPEAGLLTDTGLPRDDVAACMFAGGLPDIEIDMLYQRGEDVMTGAIVRRDDVTAAFTRFKDSVTMTQLQVASTSLDPVVDELMTFLGNPAPSPMRDVVLPKEDFNDMAECLINSASPATDLCEVYGLSVEQASQLVDTVDKPEWTVDLGVQVHKRFAKSAISPGGVHLAMTRSGLMTTFSFSSRDTEFMSITKGTKGNIQRALAEAVNSLGTGSWGEHRR